MVHRATLPNGARVLVCEMRTSPVVAMSCWIGSGAAEDPDGLPGVAHFLEHMLLRESDGVSRLARGTIGCGGRLDAETGRDYTVFREVVPSNRWRGVLSAQAAALRSVAFRRRDIERERTVILEEAASGESEPWGFVWRRLMESVATSLHGCHPAVGTFQGISRIAAPDLAAFHARHYVGGNVVQVVAGDVEADEVVDVAAAFGHVPPGTAPRSRHRAAPARELMFSRHLGSMSRTYTAMGFRVPCLLHPDGPALRAVAALLGAGGGSRLTAALARAPRSVTHASAVAVCGRDDGLLTVRAVSMPEDTGATVLWLLQEVSDLARRPPSAGEMEKLSRRLEAAQMVEHESAESIAGRIGLFETLGGFEHAGRHVERLLAVSAGDVVRVTERYLDPANATVVTYGPRRPSHGAG